MEISRCFPTFLKYEKAFHRAYRFFNPFRICKDYHRQKGEREIDVYGESPLPVIAEIVRQCDLNSSDVLFELGCGRGRGAFFFSHLTGCRVIGVDWVPFFIRTAEAILKDIEPSLPVSFCCNDMLSVDFKQATVIYLCGTCLSDETILSLCRRFEDASSSLKIITVSYALAEYSHRFVTSKQFAVVFPWGKTEVYLNKPIGIR